MGTKSAALLNKIMSVALIGVLPVDQVANQPLTLVAKETMPGITFYLFVIGSALGATATTLNSTLSWITKPLLVACDDGLLPKNLGTVSKNGVPYKLLTMFYVVGMIPLLLKLDISVITKFTTANSLLTKIMVCLALFALASKFGDILKGSSLKISPAQSKAVAVVGMIVLCILSYSLFMSLSMAVLGFLAVLVIAVAVYVKLWGKNAEIENDLIVDYTSEGE